jgi:Tol biopolymer transport system component
MKKRMAVAMLLSLLAFGAAAVVAQSGYDLYQQALVKERAVGDVEEALSLYQRIVREYAGNRPLAAKAQFRMALLYDRLGRKAEAQRNYQAVVNSYPDQADIARQARARIVKASAPVKRTPVANGRSVNAANTLTVRKVWSGAGADIEGKVSSDGRYLSFVDWTTGDVAVRNLPAGTNRRLTNKGDWGSQAFADFPIISPDGGQVAYSWFDGKRYELRLVDTEGSVPRVVYQNDEVSYLWPEAWTPDKKYVATFFRRKDRTSQLALVSPADGSTRILKSFDWSYPTDLSVSPDGKWIAYSFPPKKDESQRDIFLLATEGGRETHLIEHPANERSPCWSPDGRALLFVSDRGTSPGLWLARVADGKADGTPQLVKSNTGNIRSMGITKKGSFYYGTLAAQHDVYAVDINTESGQLVSQPQQVSQRYAGYSSIPAWSPDGSSLAYVVDRTPGFGFAGRTIIVQSVAKQKERELLHEGFELSGFNLQWSPDGNSILVAATQLSAGKPPRSGLVQIDPQTGGTKFLEEEKLVQSNAGHGGFGWFPDGKSIFRFRYVEPERKIAITKTDLVTGEGRDVLTFKEEDDLRFMRLSPDGKLFACWSIVKGTKSLTLVPVDGGAPRELLKDKLDVAQIAAMPAGIAWSPDGRQLIFGRNVAKQRTELWSIPIEDGGPKKIGVIEQNVHDIAFNPDGRRIAYSASFGSGHAEIWAMENFLPTAQSRKSSVAKR